MGVGWWWGWGRGWGWDGGLGGDGVEGVSVPLPPHCSVILTSLSPSDWTVHWTKPISPKSTTCGDMSHDCTQLSHDLACVTSLQHSVSPAHPTLRHC